VFCQTEKDKREGFLKALPGFLYYREEGPKPFPIQYIHKAYCWQVAPLQSLIPLGPYETKIRNIDK